MAYTRPAIFLKWSSGATKYAFQVLQSGYGGDAETKPASYARSWTDGSMLIVRGSTTPRRWVGQVVGDDSPVGSANDGTDDINYGDIDNLKAAWAATDLQVKAHSDTAYWDCEWTSDWDVMLEYDTFRRYAIVPMTLEER